jgi:hypothetical protein
MLHGRPGMDAAGHCWQQIEVGHKTSNIGVLLRSMRLCSVSMTNHLNIMPAVNARQHCTEALCASKSMTLVSRVIAFASRGRIPVHSRVPIAVVDCNAPWRILQRNRPLLAEGKVWRSPLHHFQRCRPHTEATHFHLMATMFPLASRGFEYRPAPDGGWSISRLDCGPLRLASDTCSVVQWQAGCR